jgi:hypothetical protein
MSNVGRVLEECLFQWLEVLEHAVRKDRLVELLLVSRLPNKRPSILYGKAQLVGLVRAKVDWHGKTRCGKRKGDFNSSNDVTWDFLSVLRPCHALSSSSSISIGSPYHTPYLSLSGAPLQIT